MIFCKIGVEVKLAGYWIFYFPQNRVTQSNINNINVVYFIIFGFYFNGCHMETKFFIKLKDSDNGFWCLQGQSLLTAMERYALKVVPVGCRGGGCGFCKIRVVEGEYECGKMSRAHAPPEAIKQGKVLACRIYPVTDLIIECLPPTASGNTSGQTEKQ